MKKMSTLFKKDHNDLGMVINEVNLENRWVFDDWDKGLVISTRKFDGTSCMIKDGELYKRYDAKINKKTGKYKRPIPEGAISCQEPDLITGHHPHWVKCDKSNPADKWHFQAFMCQEYHFDGTYELCGEKVQGNPENITGHKLIVHGGHLIPIKELNFKGIKKTLEYFDIEGIVFHHKDGRMCKIRKSDFGIKR